MNEDPEKSDEEPENSDNLVDKLREFYKSANIPIPESGSLKVPTCCIRLSSPEIATNISRMLRGRDLLFTRDREIGTIDEMTGDWRPMTEARLGTWLTLTAGIIFYSKYDKECGRPIAADLPTDKARRVLHSDELRVKLSPIDRINLVRMPVFRDELDERERRERKGFHKLELLPIGYDPPTKTFTIHGAADFPEAVEGNDGHKYLKQLLQFFEWSDDRSLAVQIAAQMTVFCHSLFDGRSPMFLYNSNLPGSGKSRLAQLALDFVHLKAGRSGYHYNDPAETRKELDATAQALEQYIWFDDVSLPPGFKMRSSDLNRWLTADVWAGRVMSTKEKFKVPLEAATFMTGTSLLLDDHIARRALVVDLFAHQRARDRTLSSEAIVLNDAFFMNSKNRELVLGSLWSLVRWWDDNDRPCASSKPLESFEGWSLTVPAIVEAAQFGDPLAPFIAPDVGDTDSQHFQVLVKALVREHCQEGEAKVTMKEIITQARLEGLFPDRLLPLDQVVDELEAKRSFEWEPVFQRLKDAPKGLRVGDMDSDQLAEFTLERDASNSEKRLQAAGWTDRSVMASWSKLFRGAALKGRWFEDENGELWQFGDRRTHTGTQYRIFRVTTD